jgi:hypothetical protein
MEIVTLEEFLARFSKQTPKLHSAKQFKKVAKVRSGNQKLRPLTEYIENKNIPEEDIHLLYENIQNRNQYLTRFYNISLQIHTDQLHMQSIPPMKSGHLDNNQHLVFKNLIRNIHLDDILQNTSSGLDNHPTFLRILTDLYCHSIIDYKLLTPSARHYMKLGRIGSIFSSFFFRASIMNPFLVYSLNQSVLHGTRIFTPTLGWTSYCYGFLECPQLIEYVGTDVIPAVCKKTRRFVQVMNRFRARENMSLIESEIFCTPSEGLYHSSVFRSKYKHHFDVVFFSPPYYRLELYSGGKQSTDEYASYEEWLEKYWKQTVQLCHHVLVKGGRLCYILSGYGTTENYNLLGDMNRITEQYFKYQSKQPMYNKDVHVTTHRETAEMIMIFTKY